MKFKVAASILAGGLVVVGIGFTLSYRPLTQRQPSAPPGSKAEEGVSAPVAQNDKAPPPAPSRINAPALPAQTAGKPKQPDAETALKDIQKDFDSGDAAAVADLLLKLEHPDKQVRKAALDILRQVDDKKAAPRLRELAEITTDAEEKAALLDTAEYLELPELGDVLAARKAAGGSIPSTSPNAQSPAGSAFSGRQLQDKAAIYLKMRQSAQAAPASQGQ